VSERVVSTDEYWNPKPVEAKPVPVAPSAAHHNRIIEAGYKRADELEARMVRVLTPILKRAGRDAAANFERFALNHMTAAAVTAAAPSPSSAMICLKPTAEQAAAIADPDGEPADQLHVTLVFLGETDDDLGPIVDALTTVAGTFAPLEGVVGGYGLFGTDNGPLGVLLPDVPGLVELRVAVTEALVAHGIEYSRNHGFEAHITVDQTPEAQEPAEMISAYGSPLSFDAVYLVRGDITMQALPLTGTAALTAAAKQPPTNITPEQLQTRTQAVEDAKAELRTALSDGSDAAHVEAAKANLRDAQANLYAASSVNPVWAAPAPAEVLDVDALVLALRTKTEPVRQAMVASTAKASIEQAGISFDVSNPYVSAAVKDTASQITNIAQTTQDNVTKVVQASYEQGLSIPDTAKAIQVAMDEQSFTRATLIARTTLVGATAAGSLAATQAISVATGTEYSKVWMTADGAKYPRHEDYSGLDGQTQPLDGVFEVGDASLSYPGDPGGPPEEVCNCRLAGPNFDAP